MQQSINCLLSATSIPMGVDWWMDFGTRDGLPCQCAKMNLETADLHAKITSTLKELTQIPEDIAEALELLAAAKHQEQKFKAWEMDLPKMWRFQTVAWIGDVDDEKLQHTAAFPGRLDEYADVSIATSWNIMRASRIILAADTVKLSAWLCCSTEDHPTTAESMSCARLSQQLIEDIIASVPMFIGHQSSPGSTILATSRTTLAEKTALALFISWPLYVVYTSAYVTNNQRKWLLGRIRYIGNERGLQQAVAFSQTVE